MVQVYKPEEKLSAGGPGHKYDDDRPGEEAVRRVWYELYKAHAGEGGHCEP